ncbi:MMPL family transporter [Nocardia gipuzkoensis]
MTTRGRNDTDTRTRSRWRRLPGGALLSDLARRSAGHGRIVVACWAVLLAAVVGLALFLGGRADDTYSVPGSDSGVAQDVLARVFPAMSGTSATVVFATPATGQNILDHADSLAEVRAAISRLPHVGAVDDPLANVSANSRAAYATVSYDANENVLTEDAVDALRQAAAPARAQGLDVEFGGPLVANTASRGSIWAELIGIAVAFVVLLLSFGSLAATVICLATTGAAVGIGLAALELLSRVTTVSSSATSIASMIGIGVAIDYSLLVVSRYRGYVADGRTGSDAIAASAATAGRAAVIAGSSVVLALLGLLTVGIPTVSAMAYATAIMVAVVLAATSTLLPALLALSGRRAHSVIPALARMALGSKAVQRRWRRWIGRAVRYRWGYLLASLGALALLAFPVAHMTLGQLDAGVDPPSTTQRRAYDLIADNFSPGTNSPLVVVLQGAPDTVSAVADRVRDRLAADPDVAAVTPAVTNLDVAVLTVIPREAQHSAETTALVDHIRALPSTELTPGTTIHVTGMAAADADLAAKIESRIPAFLAVVLGLSIIVLTFAFRAPLVAVNAAVLNVVSVVAALGVVVAVFQFGWGSFILGVDTHWSIPAYMPLLIFAFIFGLSMDYEVFILSRVREEYMRHDVRDRAANEEATITGIAASAQVIAPAALVMIAVFIGFALDPDGNIKMLGVGLATAIALDASIIRLALIPAVMALLGHYNWWPGDRRAPDRRSATVIRASSTAEHGREDT